MLNANLLTKETLNLLEMSYESMEAYFKGANNSDANFWNTICKYCQNSRNFDLPLLLFAKEMFNFGDKNFKQELKHEMEKGTLALTPEERNLLQRYLQETKDFSQSTLMQTYRPLLTKIAKARTFETSVPRCG